MQPRTVQSSPVEPSDQQLPLHPATNKIAQGHTPRFVTCSFEGLSSIPANACVRLPISRRWVAAAQLHCDICLSAYCVRQATTKLHLTAQAPPK